MMVMATQLNTQTMMTVISSWLIMMAVFSEDLQAESSSGLEIVSPLEIQHCQHIRCCIFRKERTMREARSAILSHLGIEDKGEMC